MSFPLPPNYKPPTAVIAEPLTQPPIGPERTDESRPEPVMAAPVEIAKIPAIVEQPRALEPKVNAEVEDVIRTFLIPARAKDARVVSFIDNYLICRDPIQAGSEVGLTRKESKKLIRQNDVYAAIKAVTALYPEKFSYSQEDVVEKVKEIAQLDPLEFQNPDGSFKESLADVSPEARRAVKKFTAVNMYEDDPNGMKRVVGKMIKVEFHDKMKATELLGREKDLFVEKKRVEHDIGRNMSQTLLESKQLANEHIEAQFRELTVGETKDE